MSREREPVIDEGLQVPFRATHQHYKGKEYEVLSRNLRHTETRETMVLYRDAAGRLFARPCAVFDEVITFGEHRVPRFVPLQPRAWGDVLAERRRQSAEEGYDARHDDAHTGGELVGAAIAAAAAPEAVYVIAGQGESGMKPVWPHDWDPAHWQGIAAKPRRRRLVIAAALLIAEIERLDRAGEGGA